MSEAVRLTQELVRIESTNPGKGEQKLAEYIQTYLADCGAGIHLSEALEGRCNVIAELAAYEGTSCEDTSCEGMSYEGMSCEDAVSVDVTGAAVHTRSKVQSAMVLICHMDTVVIDEGWTVNPLGGEIAEGRIYGRGACDMKSGLACALSVFRETAEKVKRGEIRLKRPLKLICTVDEEGNMRGSERAIIARDVSEGDWVLDLEPTEGQIQMAHKGRFWLEVTVHGVTAHASKPELGADAVAAAGAFISRTESAFAAMPEHEELGRPTVTFGQIQGGYQPYVVPDKCKIWLDMRLAPPIHSKAALAYIDGIIRTIEAERKGIRITYKITGNRPYIERNDNSRLMAELKKACRTVTGEEPQTGPFTGYTDTAIIAGILQNRECMSYGPGSLKQAHKPDEYVEIADIERCEAVLAQLIQRINL